MADGGCKDGSAWMRSSSSSALLSVRFLVFLVPLMIVAGYVSVKRPEQEQSNWVPFSRQPGTTSVASASSTSLLDGKEGVTETREVMAAVKSHQREEEKPDGASLNRSSPPLSPHPASPAPPVNYLLPS